jgi:asparagine N-glycosylation enzyme membrane subunit Stt3
MLKWVIVLVVGVILLGLFAPMLSKLGLWRLPGDLRFTYRGREIYLPITSTILISVVLTLVLRMFRI